MKKIKILLPVLTVLLFISFNGCDEFNSIPLNIPVTIEFSNQTGSDITFDSGIYCLSSESETYQKYQDKINSLTYLEASYRTTSVNPNVTADLSATIYNQSGSVLASYQLNNVNPADYITKPLIIKFTQSQIIAINAALSNSSCLRAVVEISSLSGSTTISGAVDIVFQADTKL